MITRRSALLALGAAVCSPYVISGARAEVAVGAITKLSGNAQVVRGSQKDKLDMGGSVFEGDRLTTASQSNLAVTFIDRTLLELGPSADTLIDEFVYNSSRQSGGSLKIARGVFKLVSGAAAHGRQDAMTINVPVGTIGIRGTHFAGRADDQTLEVVLLEPVDGNAAQEIEVRNRFGAVQIAQAGYGTDIPSPNAPPSPPRLFDVQTLNSMLSPFRSVAPRVAPPRPR
jgi:hypothetical protein